MLVAPRISDGFVPLRFHISLWYFQYFSTTSFTLHNFYLHCKNGLLALGTPLNPNYFFCNFYILFYLATISQLRELGAMVIFVQKTRTSRGVGRLFSSLESLAKNKNLNI